MPGSENTVRCRGRAGHRRCGSNELKPKGIGATATYEELVQRDSKQHGENWSENRCSYPVVHAWRPEDSKVRVSAGNDQAKVEKLT